MPLLDLDLDLVLAATGARAPAPPWLAPLLVVGFVVLWVAITAFLGFASGHVMLLARFPPVREPEQETFRFASGYLRYARFNNGLHVGIGARGLHLAPIALVRPPLHRGVPCIPWRELRLLGTESKDWMGRFTGSKFDIPSIGFKFRLYGNAGVAVARKLSQDGDAPAAPRSRLVRE